MKSILAALLCTAFVSQTAVAQSPPTKRPEAKILYVGAISINPCQDAKILADWYSKFGIETKEYKGGYYGQLDTVGGKFVFGIHPKKANAPEKCLAGISVVYRVETFEASLLTLKGKGLSPDSIEKDSQGQFAHFHDPDGNEVTVWENEMTGRDGVAHRGFPTKLQLRDAQNTKFFS